MRTSETHKLLFIFLMFVIPAAIGAGWTKGKQGPSKILANDLRTIRHTKLARKPERPPKPVKSRPAVLSRMLYKVPSPFTVSSYDDGTPDSSFDADGTARFYVSQGAGVYDEANAVAIQPDGKIVVAGFSLDASFTYMGFAVARLDTSGALDGTFGSGGSTLVQVNPEVGADLCYAVAVQPDGKIVAAGTSTVVVGLDSVQVFAVARFNSDGTIDDAFGSGGTAVTHIAGGVSDAGLSVAVKPNGKIIVGGYSEDGDGHFAFGLAQFKEDGSLDNTFGTNGTTRAFLSGSGGTEDECSTVAVQSDGKIVAAGYSADAENNWAFAVARFDTTGAPDNTFGTNGSAMTYIDGSNHFDDAANSVAVQPDGKIVATGNSADADTNYAFAVARFNADGTIDNAFGTNGTARASILGGDATDDEGTSVALQQDGKIVVAGYSANAGYYAFSVARFLDDGTLDNSFGPGGSVRTTIGDGGGGIYDIGNAVALQSDGRIVVAGSSSDLSFNLAFAVARYLASPSGPPLPVELSSFNATSSGLNAELRWTTNTEVDNEGWEVERAAVSGQQAAINLTATNQHSEIGNQQWSSVGLVKGAGTSTHPLQYSFVDRGLAPGLYSYRLSQTDRSGAIKYSQVVQVSVGSAPRVFTLSQNYPNPFNPTTAIEFTLENDGRVALKVYDILGREVATLLDETRKDGVYQQAVFDASRYSSGVYLAVLQAGGKQLIKKMLMVK